jgi:hypothetical protein
MKILVRGLMWVHFIYLLLLPTLAVVSAWKLFPGSDSWQQIAIFGFPATLMYSLFLANGYSMPDSLSIAFVQTIAIPAQIWLGVLIYGSGSIWLFFAENAAVSICSFVFGVMTIALINRQKDTSPGFFAFILFIAIILFFWRYPAVPTGGLFWIWLILAMAGSFHNVARDWVLAICRYLQKAECGI